jgi:hypothetical protein
MADAYFYSNVAVAQTIGNSGGISSGASSVYCTTTPSGYPGSYPFKLRLDPGLSTEEVVKVTAGSGTSGSPWSITRGWDGTTATSHANGAAVQHGMTAEDLKLSRDHENSGSGSGVHGLPASAWESSSLAVIGENTLSNSSTSVVTFSSIPQSYAHLMVVVQGRLTSTSAQFAEATCTINGDSAAKYSGVTCDITNSSGTLGNPASNQYSSQTSFQWFILMAAAQAGSSVNAGGGWALFPNYAGTSYNKMFVALSGFGNGTNSATCARTRWGWYNPSSQVGITTLSLTAAVGNFQTASFFGLYGID